jgi:hypothetical protein
MGVVTGAGGTLRQMVAAFAAYEETEADAAQLSGRY